MESTMPERRKYLRLNIAVEGVYRRRIPFAREKLCLAKNISRGGACILVSKKLKAQELLDLRIYLPNEPLPIKTMGKVVWVGEGLPRGLFRRRKFSTGVQFIDIRQEDQDRIESYVLQHYK